MENELIEFETFLKPQLAVHCGRINVEAYYNAIKASVEVLIHNQRISSATELTYFDALDKFLSENENVTEYFYTKPNVGHQ